MISKAQVLRENSSYKSLINAVLNNLSNGVEDVENINSHGIDGGYGNFIYYSDTHKFAMRYRKMIVRLLEETAEQCDTEVVELVAGFGIFRRSPMDAEDRKDLYKYLGGGRPEQGAITNIMAWFAAEEVCRMFDR